MRISLSKQYLLASLLLVLSFLGFGNPASAQTWQKTSGTNAWNDNANWSPAVFPNAVGATAIFGPGTGAQTGTLGIAITLASLQIDTGSTIGASYSFLTSGSFIFDATGTAETSITVDGTNNVTNVSTRAITLSDDLRVTVNNTASTGAGGALSLQGDISGSKEFFKDGAGLLTFTNGTKTTTGKVTVSQGILRMTVSGAITGGTSDITVNSGGQFRFDTAGNPWSLGVAGGRKFVLNGAGDVGSSGALRAEAGGDVTVANEVNLASGAAIHVESSSGTLTINGSLSGSGLLTKTGAGSLVIANTSTSANGGVRVTNGTVAYSSSVAIGGGAVSLAQSALNNTAIYFNSAQSIGDLSTVWADISGTKSQRLNLGGNTLTVTQTTDATFGNGAVATLTGIITGSGGKLIKSGGAALTLTGANTYTGGTTVSGGKLIVSNLTGSGTGTGSVNVDTGGTLGGNGFITGAASINLGGTLSPGTSAGKLTFSGTGNNVTMVDDSEYRAELGAPTTPGTDFDQVALDGGGGAKVFTPGGATLRLIALGGITTGGTDTYKIVTATNGASIAAGSFFQNLNGTPMSSEVTTYTQGLLSFTINYETSFVAVTFSTVPEPSMLGLCLVPLLFTRRRSRR